MPNDSPYILTLRHTDFELLVDCSHFIQIRDKALSHLQNEEKLLTPYFWSGEVEEMAVCGREVTKENNRAHAFFFENTTYPVWFDFGSRKLEQVEWVSFFEKDKDNFQLRRNIYFGFVNYGNEIGKSDITIRYKLKDQPEQTFKLEFYVLSTKLDYFSDWNVILRDIEREYQMLSLSFLQRTYHSFEHSPQGETPDIIWWNLFNEYQQRFIRAVKLIMGHPHQRLSKNVSYERADKLNKIRPSQERELERFKQVASHLYRTEKDTFTHDTPENRFLKYALQKITDRFLELKHRILVLPDFSASYKDSLELAGRQLKQLVQHPFFRNVGVFKGFLQESLVLQRAAGYSEVYRVWLVLRSSYSLQEGMHQLRTKDIATLYEIWCFISVKNMVGDYLKRQQPELITDNRSRMELNRLFSFDLAKGENSRVIFRGSDTELAELIYNPKSDDSTSAPSEGAGWDERVVSKTVSQKPDIVLRLSKKDYQNGIKLTYLFDAKYRIDVSEKVKLRDGSIRYVDRPPEDAINQMHRYRDAILFSTRNEAGERLQKEVVGGYILFPGRGDDDAFEASKFMRSQASVNIGAFPLRPSDAVGHSETLLREFIEKLLTGGASGMLKDSIPQKGLEYKPLEEARVFIGVVNSSLKAYPDFVERRAGLYYTGKMFPSTYNILSFKYFAPYISGEGIAGYYEITGIRSATKGEMLQNHDTDETFRFFFELGEYHLLPHKLQKVRLLQNSYKNVLLSELEKGSIV